MHLVENYAATGRLKIDKPFLIDSFYPLPFEDPYVLITASTGMPGKNYRYWNDVLRFVRKIGLKTIQVGMKDDPPLDVDFNICGQTSISQLFGLAKNAILILCGDTALVHIASVYKTPLVSVFGLTDPKISGPYEKWKTEEQICLEPDRTKYKATFNPEDGSVNNIYPDKICEAIVKIFSIEEPVEKIHYIGSRYSDKVIEVIPDHILAPHAFNNGPVTIRNDYLDNEENTLRTLSGRKSLVVTKTPLDLNALSQLRENIMGFAYEIDINTDINYVKGLMRLGLSINLFSSHKDISDVRFKFLDVGVPVLPKPVFERKENLLDFSIRTNKILLSDGNIYSSKNAWLDGDCIDTNERVGKVYDTEDFWNEQEFFMFVENR